jgi:hypothetical protein
MPTSNRWPTSNQQQYTRSRPQPFHGGHLGYKCSHLNVRCIMASLFGHGCGS